MYPRTPLILALDDKVENLDILVSVSSIARTPARGTHPLNHFLGEPHAPSG